MANSKAQDPKRKVYSAPRRFDLATIFAVTTAYAMFLGVLSWLGAPAALVVYLSLCLAVVGLGQALLFGGRRPRLASLCVGAVVFSIPGIIYILMNPSFLISPVGLFAISMYLVQGAMFGYVAGALIGGIFLVADIIRRKYGRRDAPNDTQPSGEAE